jgi:hypothetical protein
MSRIYRVGSGYGQQAARERRAPWENECGGCWEKEYYSKDNVFIFPTERKCDSTCDEPYQYWQYTADGACDWWDFAWRYFAIDLYDGRVVAKHYKWMRD